MALTNRTILHKNEMNVG